MTRSMVSMSKSDHQMRVNAGAEPAHLADAEPSAKARMLRGLAAAWRAPPRGRPNPPHMGVAPAHRGRFGGGGKPHRSPTRWLANRALGERRHPMNPLVNKTASVDGGTAVYPDSRRPIDMLANVLAKAGLPQQDVDYHLLRAAMVL